MASLAQLPQDRYDDPLAHIDWDAVDTQCWWLPPDTLSLAGVPEFEELPACVRRRVSHVEYAHLLQAGLWLESIFMARLATLAHRSDDAACRARFLQEVREEAGHSLMFVELLHRSGLPLRSGQGATLRVVDALARLLPTGSALFWALVVVGEELPDRLNRRLKRGIDEVTLSSVVYRMVQIHTHDEAVHAAYAREQCAQAASGTPNWLRMLLAPPLSLAIALYADYVYYPPARAYACAGLADPQRWRSLARCNASRHAQVADMLRPTLGFLRRCGWRVRSRHAAH
ncbi:MAG TPA: diiron oxygenase [Casimicrobiaceae bacterium]|nr:diiron oxygenase [Casimicrobiaceae bacterium]